MKQFWRSPVYRQEMRLARINRQLLAACTLGDGFHTDGATLLEEAAHYLEPRFPVLADELRRKAMLERAAIAAVEGET